jgi:hypothetical protein
VKDRTEIGQRAAEGLRRAQRRRFSAFRFSPRKLFPLLRQALFAHQHKASLGAFNLIGQTGTAEEDLQPEGAILIQGEVWRARAQNGATIENGQFVRVVGARNYLLEVVAASACEREREVVARDMQKRETASTKAVGS